MSPFFNFFVFALINWTPAKTNSDAQFFRPLPIVSAIFPFFAFWPKKKFRRFWLFHLRRHWQLHSVVVHHHLSGIPIGRGSLNPSVLQQKFGSISQSPRVWCSVSGIFFSAFLILNRCFDCAAPTGWVNILINLLSSKVYLFFCYFFLKFFAAYFASSRSHLLFLGYTFLNDI